MSSVGISLPTKTLDARTRCMKSHSIRTIIISGVLDYLGLNHLENESNETKYHWIKIEIKQSFEFYFELHPNLEKSFRALIGRILTITQENWLRAVLSYPLTPVHMCFSHMNGAMNKTTKSTLSKELQKRNKSLPPRIIDAFVVDDFLLLQTINNIHATFGKLERC